MKLKHSFNMLMGILPLIMADGFTSGGRQREVPWKDAEDLRRLYKEVQEKRAALSVRERRMVVMEYEDRYGVEK